MFQRLLVPLDGGELAPRSIEAGIALARRLGAAITGFIVEPPVPLPSVGVRPGPQPAVASVEELRTDEHAQRLLAKFELAARRAGVPFNADFSHTHDIAGSIIEAAQRNGCDLIVMVTHRRGPFGRLLHGSHTRQVLARTETAVLVMN